MIDPPSFARSNGRHPELADQVAVVTGAARGIGQGIAFRLAEEGMRLALADIDEDSLTQTVALLGTSGVEVIPVAGDLSDSAVIERLMAETIDSFGELNLLVNNAADLRRHPILEAHDDLLDHQLALNIRSPYLCAQRAAAIMAPTGRGGIVNISSVGAVQAHHTGNPYDVSKGAINAMTRALAVELGPHGVRVNAVAPGVTITHRSSDGSGGVGDERIPLRRFGTVADIAAAVAFLASTDSSYLTGQVLYVDGGITAQLSPPSTAL